MTTDDYPDAEGLAVLREQTTAQQHDPQTAMLLTETEWADLAAMLAHYRYCTEWADDSVPPSQYRRRVHANQIAALEENVADLRRKRALAQRIIEAAS